MSGMIKKLREEEPIAVSCDFGVVYSLFLRPHKNSKQPPRIILKITWEAPENPEPDGETRSCAFEIDLQRERLMALGRKGNSLPAEKFPAKWFCEWARRELAAQ